MKATTWKLLMAGALLVATSAIEGDAPATVIGHVTLNWKPPGRPLTVEFTAVEPKIVRDGIAMRVTATDDKGRFMMLGLSPAETYVVKVTFPGLVYSRGPLNDVRAGDVRYVSTNVSTAICGTNHWREERDRSPQPVFEWPLRDRRNQIWICE